MTTGSAAKSKASDAERRLELSKLELIRSRIPSYLSKIPFLSTALEYF